LLFLIWLAGCTSSGGAAGENPAPEKPQPVADFRAAPPDLNAPFLRAPMVEKGVFRFDKGDTFLGAMNVLGVPRGSASVVARSLEKRCGLKQISRGQEINYEIVEGKGLASFRFPCTTTEILHVNFEEGFPTINFEKIYFQEIEKVYVVKVQSNSSLIGSAARAGVSDGQVMNLARNFRSDIDFNNDIHPGDELRIWVKEMQGKNGKTLAPGDILAALFVLKGKEIWGIWYEGPEGAGYFDEKGRSLKKSFLKSPLPFLRVTSGFKLRRFHPILGKVRPHLGVDFGAPTGTPIMAAANGKVVFAGWMGGDGNAVKIRHSPQLLTLYGHMSKILVKHGQSVKQGKVIGHVGTTGLSTGPHLHYGLYRNGKAIDPMKVKMDVTSIVNSKKIRARRDRAIKLLRSPTPGNVPK